MPARLDPDSYPFTRPLQFLTGRAAHDTQAEFSQPLRQHAVKPLRMISQLGGAYPIVREAADSRTAFTSWFYDLLEQALRRKGNVVAQEVPGNAAETHGQPGQERG